MTFFLEPPPVGDPAAMHAYADELARRAELLGSHADSLKTRSFAATFLGPAGDRFREFVGTQHTNLLAVSGDLNELAVRIHSQAYEVTAALAAWERYRDAVIERQVEATRRGSA